MFSSLSCVKLHFNFSTFFHKNISIILIGQQYLSRYRTQTRTWRFCLSVQAVNTVTQSQWLREILLIWLTYIFTVCSPPPAPYPPFNDYSSGGFGFGGVDQWAATCILFWCWYWQGYASDCSSFSSLPLIRRGRCCEPWNWINNDQSQEVWGSCSLCSHLEVTFLRCGGNGSERRLYFLHCCGEEELVSVWTRGCFCQVRNEISNIYTCTEALSPVK